MITGFFSASVSKAQEDNIVYSSSNSQKMALLEAAINSNPIAPIENDITIKDDAIASDITMADVVDLRTQTNTISTYKVQSGDNISSIAKEFGVSASTILWANNLTKTSKLKIGQTLVILPVSGVQYKVKSGDTIGSIAKKFGGDQKEIIAFNNLEEGKLKIGDLVIIPDGIMPASGSNSIIPKYASDIPDDYYMRPIKGGTHTQGIHGWNAVDLAASCGTPLYASAGGTVIVAKNDGLWNGGYANYVVISHNNKSQTVYGHMQDAFVSPGQVVAKGEQIGLLGNTGNVKGVTGCHVHFELRNGPRNPF